MSLSTDISIINSFKEEAKEKGVTRVTIGNIADRCGCARQTVYYHFRGTMDLIRWVTQNEFMGVQYDAMEKTPWKDEMFRLLCTIKENEWMLVDLYSSKYWNEYQDFLMDIIKLNVIDTFFYKCTDFGTAKNKENLARMLTYSFLGEIIDWMKGGFVETPHEIVGDLARLCGASMHRLIEDFLVLRPQERRATAN